MTQAIGDSKASKSQTFFADLAYLVGGGRVPLRRVNEL
jgi:hypothetical protein